MKIKTYLVYLYTLIGNVKHTQKILVLEIATWQVMKEVQIHKATVYEKHKLLKELLLPGFDIEKFPYSIQYD